MLVSGNQIRLDARERQTLAILTGASPAPIKSRSQLRAFIQRYLALYSGPSPEERLLRRLLESFLSN